MQENPLATLAAAIASLVAIIAGFTLSGTMGRILRNEGALLAIAVVLVLIGAIAFITVQWVSAGKKEGRQKTALVFGVLGVMFVVAAGISAAQAKEQPSIDAKISEDGRFLSATVKASNLASSERIAVVVDGLAPSGGQTYGRHVLWQGYVGPDSDGNVTLPVHARIAPSGDARLRVRAWSSETEAPCEEPGRPITNEQLDPRNGTEGTACVVLPAPRVTERPQLSVSEVGGGKITLAVKASNDPGRVVLHVVGRRKGTSKVIHRSVLQPDGDGAMDAKTTLPVPAKTQRVCAEVHALGADGKRADVVTPPCPMRRRSPAGTALEVVMPAT